ncbi:MAG: c-type cytochrome [Gammaproteobacteria bacterium]|nr:c-type cytochrome [Gammaproteobacteria bacterium]
MRTTPLLVTMTLACVLHGCGQTADPQSSAYTTPAGSTPIEKWSRSCSLCHVNGIGGAPRVGDTEDWAPRLAQGDEVLLTHTIEGFNNMPPLGYCMDCERPDFVALIKFMSSGSRP